MKATPSSLVSENTTSREVRFITSCAAMLSLKSCVMVGQALGWLWIGAMTVLLVAGLLLFGLRVRHQIEGTWRVLTKPRQGSKY